MSPKYRFLLALLLTLVAICSQVVFGQTKTIAQKVHVGIASVSIQLKNLQSKSCTTPGAIDISTLGGTPPYTYSWTSSTKLTATTEDINNLDAGSYSVTVSDANGCSYTGTWTVSSSCTSACNLTDVSSITNTTACNIANGNITVTINGGSGNYGYTWYNNNFNIITNTKNLTNAAAGNYYLEVTDLNNPSCVSFFYYTIDTPFKFTAAVTANTTCNTPFTGTINPTVTGGSGNYTYTLLFPNGKTSTKSTPSFTGLAGGSYKLAIEDNIMGCKTEKSLFVATATSLPLAISETITPQTTCSPFNGAVDISVVNGTGSYTYSWLNQATGSFVSAQEDLTQAESSTYTLYVQDAASGCNISKKISIENKTVVPAFTTTITPSTSCSEPNGNIDVSLTTSGTYQFLWSQGTTTWVSEDLNAASPGTYALRITDSNTGCSTLASALTIADESPEQLNFTSIDIKPNSNCSSPNGSIELNIDANTAYTLSWSGPNGYTSSFENLTALDSGVYTATLTLYCNQAPVIQAPVMKTTGKTITVDLKQIITDPDNNLDFTSFEILEQPVSGAMASINNTMLEVEYAAEFKGTDNMRIRACDLLDACTENAIALQVEVTSEIIVYNAVAPNSPGDNKFMRIENLPSGNTVSIFNRWGDAVFAVHNYKSEVPGKRFEGNNNNGNPLPTGTYFYKIELANSDALTGYLSLKQ